jgi:hypothetical protein
MMRPCGSDNHAFEARIGSSNRLAAVKHGELSTRFESRHVAWWSDFVIISCGVDFGFNHAYHCIDLTNRGQDLRRGKIINHYVLHGFKNPARPLHRHFNHTDQTALPHADALHSTTFTPTKKSPQASALPSSSLPSQPDPEPSNTHD